MACKPKTDIYELKGAPNAQHFKMSDTNIRAANIDIRMHSIVMPVRPCSGQHSFSGGHKTPYYSGQGDRENSGLKCYSAL